MTSGHSRSFLCLEVQRTQRRKLLGLLHTELQLLCLQLHTQIDLRHDTVPDETTICKCRHLLDAYRPTSRMFDAV